MNWYKALKTSSNLVHLPQETLKQVKLLSNRIPALLDKAYRAKKFARFDSEKSEYVNAFELGDITVHDKYTGKNELVNVLCGLAEKDEDAEYQYFYGQIIIMPSVNLYLKDNSPGGWESVLIHEITHFVDPHARREEADYLKERAKNPDYVAPWQADQSDLDNPDKYERYATSPAEIVAISAEVIRGVGDECRRNWKTLTKVKNWLSAGSSFASFPWIGRDTANIWDRHPEILRNFKIKLYNHLQSIIPKKQQMMRSAQEKMNIKQHLIERGVNLENTNVPYDEESGLVYFPLYNRMKQNIGFQRYKPDGSKSTKEPADMKYHTVIPNVSHKGNALWGVEYIDFDKATFIFVTEGIFDAIKIKNLGYPVVATMTNAGSPSIKTQLKLWGLPTIAILDNDPDPVHSGSNKLKKTVDFSFVTPSPYKDLGEMPQEEARIFIEKCLKELGLA